MSSAGPPGIPRLQDTDPTGGFLFKGLFQLIVTTCLWGMYAMVMPVASYLLLRKGFRSKATVTLLFVICSMFAITTAFFVLLASNDIITLKIRVAQEANPSDTSGTLRALQSITVLRLIEIWPRVFNFTIGDAVVVWRCFALYQTRWIRGGLIILLVSSAVFSVYDGVSTTIEAKDPANVFNANLGAVTDTIANGLSFATNLVATLLFTYKTWSHRKTMKENMGSSRRSRSKVERVMALLMESSIIYCVFQFVAVVLNAIEVAPGSALDIGTSVYFAALNVISGLYPTLLICLIASQRNNLGASHSASISTARFTDANYGGHSMQSNAASIQKYAATAPFAVAGDMEMVQPPVRYSSKIGYTKSQSGRQEQGYV